LPQPTEAYEEEVAEPMWAEPRSTERGRAYYYARFRSWLEENGIERHPDSFVGLQGPGDQDDRALRPEGEWRRPEGVEKVVLVSLGSAFTHQPGFYRECVRAFGGLDGWHLVLQIGGQMDAAERPNSVTYRPMSKRTHGYRSWRS
jgi:UDP:flavonoid glycosyltransferase YjiC (YdhE family)